LLGTIESDWRRFIPEFARHHHTVAVDLRGHGRTNNPQRSLSLEQLVRDLRILCDTLELQRPFFLTHGVAAHIPLAYANNPPASVGGMLLHAPVLVGDAHVSHQAVEELTRHGQPDEMRRRHEGIESDDSLRTFLASITALVEEFGRNRIAEDLRWNAAPMLITGGNTMEGAALARLRQLAAASPRVSLEILPASGALPGTIQKLPFVTVVSAFVHRAAAERSGLELDTESSS